ncbi:MAG: hypothetical protein AAF125_03450 [Chloroflexota bacterium]
MNDYQPDETQNLGETKHMETASPPTSRPPRRKGSFIPPLWSLLVMVVFVALAVGALVLGVYALGATSVADAPPQVVVVTSPPDATATPVVVASPTISGAVGGAAVPNFALEGPTLPPVFLSPTPDVISLGRRITVNNVGSGGLNVRSGPGIDSALVFISSEGSTLEIMAGPESAREDSFTWWRVRDPFTGEEGWAVDLYMEVQPLAN